MLIFGQPAQPQPTGRLTWQQYIDRIQNGPAPQYSPPSNAQQPQGPGTTAGFGNSGSGGGGGGLGGSGLFGDITGGKHGGGDSRLPATPVNYDRMHSILNSGVLTGGHAQTAAEIPPPAAQPAPAPTPAPAPKQNPFESFFASLMGGAR